MRWKYYNHAIIQDTPPKINVSPCPDPKSLFKKYPSALMIKYTTNLDQYDETKWWYCIKDSKFDVDSIKSKRRNVINNAIRNFSVRFIEIENYINEISEILIDANKGYSYDIQISPSQIIEKCKIISKKKESKVLGAFLISENVEENDKLCGYLWIDINEKCVNLVEQKVIRKYEKLQINAALINELCNIYNDYFDEGWYLCDGERNIVHQSTFQDYLIKYFNFRKAYCKLNVIYNKKISWMIKILYFIKNLLAPLIVKSNNNFIHKINGILLIEDVLRWQKNEKI